MKNANFSLQAPAGLVISIYSATRATYRGRHRRLARYSKVIDYGDLRTEIRAVWTDYDLLVLFICPYRTLNLFLPPDNSKARSGLWDRDVVEIFFGDDWETIRHYREFEIAPTADWIDLAIDLDHRKRRPRLENPFGRPRRASTRKQRSGTPLVKSL